MKRVIQKGKVKALFGLLQPDRLTPGLTLKSQSNCHGGTGTCKKIQLLDAWLQCTCDLQTLAVFDSFPYMLATLQV